MNCRAFQHRMYEYLDGMLSPRVRTAAENHLAQCALCRQAVERQRQLAAGLSAQFRRTTQSLRLPREVAGRVLSALSQKAARQHAGTALGLVWRRLVWRLALAASALALALLVAGHFFRTERPKPEPEAARSQPGAAPGAVSVHGSYVLATYTFRREGNIVIDALDCRTNTVNEQLWAGQDSQPRSKERERKMTL